jgi:kelch-like protein 17 (actinfilin)/kelch-like protein 20
MSERTEKMAVGFLVMLGTAAVLALVLAVTSRQSVVADSSTAISLIGNSQQEHHSMDATQFDAWMTRAPMTTGRNLPAAAVVSDTIYVLGGWQGSVFPGTALTTTEAYSPTGDGWMPKAGMANDRNALAAAVVGGKVYAIGGWSSSAMTVTAAVESYDPATDVWAPVAPLPSARQALAAAVVDGEVYVFGGWDSRGITNTVTAYNPVSDTWRICTSMPTARTGLAAAVVDDKIYVIGGHDGVAVTGQVEIYDPATDSWSMGADMPTARWLLGAAAIHGKVYAVGGNETGDFGTPLTINEEYDPVTDAWKAVGSMPTARWGMAVAVAGDRLYALGGASLASGWDTVNEVYFPPAPYRTVLPLIVRNAAQ